MRTLALLFLAAASLTACNTPIGETFDTRTNAGSCPPFGAIYDVSRYVKFNEGGSETYDNITYTGEVVDMRLACRYADDDPLQVELEIDFAFGKGNAAPDDAHTYPYFIAVTRRSGKVLSKERFAVEADFDGSRVTGVTERIARINIPRADETISGVNFEILVGFELTEDQLAFNRAGKRFRLDAQE